MTCFVALLLALGLLVPAAAVESPALSGQVTGDAGQPLAGALVTATAVGRGRATTVYADEQGGYRFWPMDAGRYHLRARAYGYRDRTVVTDVDHGRSRREALVLERETDARDLAWQLPANRWLALAKARLPDDAAREEFVRQCTFCHQQGSWATRVQRDPEEWRKLFALMARMGGVLSSRVREVLPAALNAAWDESSYVPALGAQFLAPPPPDAAARLARVTEWEVGTTGSMPHDVAVGADGRVWAVDMTWDTLYGLDPRTGERRAYPMPGEGLPLGGVFGGMQPIPANAGAHVGPHSVQVAPDGGVWITLALGNKLARFDPARERFDLYDEPAGLYPHTLRFDQRGRIWYTLAVSNHIGLLDPASGERRSYRLPARTWGESLAARTVPFVLWLNRRMVLDPERAGDGPWLPTPYGIDVAPDGSVWFSQLNQQRIGRLDPATGEVRLYDTPFPAPRRLRFDSRGRLWIPSFSSGAVARFDPATAEFRTWELPTEPRGTETPYALNVDRRTDVVWVCGTQSDTLIRFDPGHEQFTVYPLPTRVTYTREIDFDHAGAVWTANSNLPAWQIEGAVPKVIRLEPGA
jgi:streptogramin lyase